MNRLTLTPTVALALALAAMSVPVFAQSTPTCFTGSIFGGPFTGPAQCFVAQSLSPNSGGAVAPKPAPVVVAPAAPASVPASTLTPATPAPGVITGNVADTEYAGAAPGYYENVSFNGGTYNAIVAPDGTYIARPVN